MRGAAVLALDTSKQSVSQAHMSSSIVVVVLISFPIGHLLNGREERNSKRALPTSAARRATITAVVVVIT